MSAARPLERLLVCYLPALDLRQVAEGAFPYVAGLLERAPSVRFRAQPTTDQLATMLTGTWPHEHGFWGPRLKAEWRDRTPAESLLDRLPDLLTTSVQGAWHLVNGPIDFATIAPRRRRRFEWLRFNLKHATDTAKTMRSINGLATPFTLLDGQPGRDVYHDDYWDLDRLLARIASGDQVLEIVDVHCLDHLQHWRMADRPGMAGFYRGIDRFLVALFTPNASSAASPFCCCPTTASSRSIAPSISPARCVACGCRLAITTCSSRTPRRPSGFTTTPRGRRSSATSPSAPTAICWVTGSSPGTNCRSRTAATAMSIAMPGRA